MEETEELYNADKIKELLKIKESTYRSALRGYRKYIPSRKANKNKDLFPVESVEIIGTITKLRKMGFERSEIVSQIKKMPEYINTRSKYQNLKDNQDLMQIMGSTEISEFVDEFVVRIRETKKEISFLKTTLEKRTKNYQEEIGSLEHKLNTHREDTKQMVDSTNENMSKLLKQIWSLEEELKQIKNETFFQKLKRLFKF